MAHGSDSDHKGDVYDKMTVKAKSNDAIKKASKKVKSTWRV
jgi:hypothetical protein